jgi:RNA polymerase sigma factor (sigma-70 family)
MHPALAKLTPREALDLVRSPLLMQQWIGQADVPYREAVDVIFDRADEALDQPPPPPDPRRRDRDRLIAFVDTAEGLPRRLREVARFCLEDGLTLRECGARLGITRETVRVHLRRLRALERQNRHRLSASTTVDW